MFFTTNLFRLLLLYLQKIYRLPGMISLFLPVFQEALQERDSLREEMYQVTEERNEKVTQCKHKLEEMEFHCHELSEKVENLLKQASFYQA